jgi:hypothetical protein
VNVRVRIERLVVEQGSRTRMAPADLERALATAIRRELGGAASTESNTVATAVERAVHGALGAHPGRSASGTPRQ